MSLFTSIDLSELPTPSVVEELDYETLLAATKTQLKSLDPTLDVDNLPESDPISKLLEIMAYREMHLRQRINEAAQGVMLATATGSNLDNLAALVNIERLIIEPGDGTNDPVYETDSRLRARTQLAFEGFSTAGPEGAYIFHAMSASSLVKDVAVYSELPGEVEVRILSSEGDGKASGDLLNAVEAVLNDDKIRPITDHLTVNSADIEPFTINATLMLFPGVGAQEVLESAKVAAQAFVDKHHSLGIDITRAGIFAALYQPGVQNIVLTSPDKDISIARYQAPYGTVGTISSVEHPTEAPLNPASAMSFLGSVSNNQITGEVTITAASEDYDITHYVVYWGANNAEKLPNGTQRYTFSEEAGKVLSLDHDNIEDLLITSDDGKTIYLEGQDYSVDSVLGEVTATNAAIENTTVRVSYGLPAIAEIAKGDNLSHTFASNTAIPAGATHLLVFTRNEFGEMREGVSAVIA